PMIGQFSSERISSRYSAWKVITLARSPVIPKMTRASASRVLSIGPPRTLPGPPSSTAARQRSLPNERSDGCFWRGLFVEPLRGCRPFAHDDRVRAVAPRLHRYARASRTYLILCVALGVVWAGLIVAQASLLAGGLTGAPLGRTLFWLGVVVLARA